MSTLFWIPASGSAPVSPTPSATDWDGHINSVSRPLNLVRGSTALTTLAYAPDAADHLTNVATMISQYVSEILPPQVVAAQQIGFGGRFLESNALNNLLVAWKVYGVDIAGSSVLGTMVPIQTMATEIPASLTGKGRIAAGSAITFNEPWRLVLEVGADGLPATGGGRHNFSFVEGEAFATGAMSLVQDADTGACPPMLIFSGNLLTQHYQNANSGIGI